MQTTCPCCGARFPLEAALNDAAGREMMTLVATLPTELSRAALTYLSLFRSSSRALAWQRALKLIREVIGLSTPAHLVVALNSTLDSLRPRQGEPGWKPLKNHNYLKQVLASVEAQTIAPITTPTTPPVTPARLSKHAQAIAALDS